MKKQIIQFLVCGFLFAASISPAFAQSQAMNGQIQGTISDQNNLLIQGTAITVTNIESGATRAVTTDENGVYRFPLLPLGNYRITAEAAGFKKFIRDGIILATGQTAMIDIILETGDISEVVMVSLDTSVTASGKTDLGRVMNSREVHNVPQPTRNPYNFVVLEGGVTGRPNRGFNYPQINVNGFARRVNYLLDGNTNTRGDIAGARLMSMSDTFVNEVQLLPPGYSAEFGNTTGMVVNMVTPSGANDLHGSALYFFRRPGFYARPFFFSAEDLPDNVTNNFAGTIGGPIKKDRWHFYFGYEYVHRDDSTRANNQVTITGADKTALIAAGLPESIFVPAIPSQEFGSHFIFRTDAQLNGSNRFSARFNLSDLGNSNAILGRLNTLERSIDIRMVDHSIGLQLASYTDPIVNELRFQFVQFDAANQRSTFSGMGPSITITNTANFGSPTDAGVTNLIKGWQIQDNVTLMSKSHAIKIGGGFSATNKSTWGGIFSLYAFPDIPSYVAAMGGDSHNYARYDETFGDPGTRNRSTLVNLFVLDDWKATRRLKFNYGLRYDLYLVPEADPAAPYPASREFTVDKNNIAPRIGLVYSLHDGKRPLILRASTGIYYEPPWLDMYTRALRENGAPAFFTRTFCGDRGGPLCPRDPLAPPFPLTFSGSLPAGTPLPPQNIVTVATDFENMYAIHSSIQLEQTLSEHLSIAAAYVHSGGRHIPVYRSINWTDPVRYLSDGRPVFGPERADPRFNIIQIAESAGVSRYDALMLQLTQRYRRGIQFAAAYTLSRSVDDAPEQNVTYTDGSKVLRALSDPTDRSFDKGYSFGDQRHTFVMSMVASPKFKVQDRALRYLSNNNQLGVIATANSGERFNIRTAGDIDLNGDGLFFSDRPVGIGRNSGKTPSQFNVDIRYSRFFEISERYKLEFILEVQNLFNINSIIAYNNVTVTTNPVTGEMIGALPDFKARNQSVSLESRQAQLGLKFVF